MGKIVVSDKKMLKESTLRVNLTKHKISFAGILFKYRDKDTRQIVVFIPSLDITGYGATDKKALVMLNFLMNDYLQWLGKLSPKQIEAELTGLGWKHVKFKNKEYSQSYVDQEGELHTFNAVGNEVEKLTVVA
jgi:hypothetical protein